MNIIVKTCTHGTSELSINVLAGIAGDKTSVILVSSNLFNWSCLFLMKCPFRAVARCGYAD
jgi:hypothetical protein